MVNTPPPPCPLPHRQHQASAAHRSSRPSCSTPSSRPTSLPPLTSVPLPQTSQAASGQCRASFVAFGLLYALVASNLIVAHMAKEPVSVPVWAYSLLLLAAVNTQFSFVDRKLASLLLLGVTLVGYSHYVVNVINEICAALGIHVFKIKVHPPPPKKAD